MVGPFALEGYDVLGPLDAAGRSWRAICLVDGDGVVLRRWIGGASRLAEIRRRAALWGSVAGGGVVAVRDVVALGDDAVVVTERATGGGLDTVVTRCGGLTAGQIVTVVAPIAQTLAAAHERGLVHGRVSLSNVVLNEDGRPMLTDWLLVGNGQPDADVAALAAMALGCLTDDASGTVAAALRSAHDPRRLAKELLAAVAAEPLLAPPRSTALDAVVSEPLLGARRAATAVLVIVALVVAIAVGGGVIWGRGSDAGGVSLPPRVAVSAAPTPPPTARATDWLSVVRVLERRRLRAFAVGDKRVLAAAEVRGTPLWRNDSRLLTQLRNTSRRLRDAHVRVRSVRMLSVRSGSVALRVVDAFSSYDVVRLRLRRMDGSWLIAGVSRRSP